MHVVRPDTVQPVATGHREGGMKIQCSAAVKRAAVVQSCVGQEIVVVLASGRAGEDKKYDLPFAMNNKSRR